MSKPRYGWWGYVKWMIRQYPARQDRFCQGDSWKERKAVEQAVEETKGMENGKERLQVIEMVFFRQTHTLEGAAMMVPCHYKTAQKWHNDFIRLVASKYGFNLKETPKKPNT